MHELADVDAVLLDVGGVFYLPDHAAVRGALSPFDVDASPEAIDRAHYAGAAELREVAEVGHHADGTPTWHVYQRAYVEVCGVGPSERDDAVTALLARFGQDNVWTRPVAGAREALGALATRGYALGVVSNSDGTIEQHLRDDRLCQVGPGSGVAVGVVLDSTAVGVSKPDPAIFELALEALGAAPERTIHVGDTPAADVAGAVAAGIRPVLVDPYDLHADADCPRVRSLGHLVELLPARLAT